MRKRTPSEIKAYGDGYIEAYIQFQYLIEKHEISTAVRKMKIFADAVALTVEIATDTADTPQTDCEDTSCPYFKNPDYSRCMKYKSQTESTGSPIGDYRDGVGAWRTDCDDRYAIRTDSGEVVAYTCPLGCEQTDCPWE